MNDTLDLSDCRNCLCLAARSAARGVTAVYDRQLRPHGVRATQFTILTMLEMRGATPVSALAKGLGMDRTTLTRNIALIEANGWAQARANPKDARSHLLSITTKGRGLVRDALPAWRKAQASVAEAFGATGVAALHKLAGTTIS